jgi:uncharacterized protein (DUF1330 family)
MAAYLIVKTDVTDPEQFEKYRAAVPPVIEQYGGRYLVRGGATEALEGDPDLARMVVLEFDSADAAKAFWNSAEYGEAKKLRKGAANFDVLLVEGM